MQFRQSLRCVLLFAAAAWAVAGNAATKGDEKQFEILAAGRELLQNHKPAQAISDHFDKVIRYYESQHGKSKVRIFCARSQPEVLAYAVWGAAEKATSHVLSCAWGDAYYLKAYALVELNHLAEARQALAHAIELSPMNSLYLSENAHLDQTEKNWEKALEGFKLAAEAAETTTPEDQKVFELTRALRGQGFALIELNRLDEAEALYRRALELNPDDEGSKGEIRYLERMRANLAAEAEPFTKNPEWVITARVAFVETDRLTARPRMSQGDFKLWFPWIGGDLYGAPTTNDFIQPAIDPDYSFTIDLNASRQHLIRSLDSARFASQDLSVTPADTRVARVATFTLKPDLSDRVGFTSWMDGDNPEDSYILAYFDRACSIIGTMHFGDSDAERKYDIAIPAAGYYWLRSRKLDEKHQEMVVGGKPANLVLAVTPLDD